MISKSKLVIVRKCNKRCYGVIFDTEQEAKKYVLNKYTSHIKQVPSFDYENTYIAEDMTYAKISAGIHSLKIMLCNEIVNL